MTQPEDNTAPMLDSLACQTDLLLHLLAIDRPPKPELAAQGWERRFMADGRRLGEFTDLYASLGYEVHAEPVHPDEIGPDCGDCRLIMCLQFHTLYTRKPG
jgi:hypothetical protein